MSGSESVLSQITDWAIGLMQDMGGPGAGLAIAMENLFPPIPSEVILPLAGLAAGQGKMSFFSAIVWTTAGSVIGAVMLYYVGVLLGRDRLVTVASKLPLVKVSDIEKTEAWFNKHGGKAVFFGRFVPIFRSFISVPAGLERMSMLTFVPFTAAGSLIWNTTFIFLGYKLGKNWEAVEHYVDLYSKGVIAVVVLAVLVFIALRIRSIRKERREGDGGDDGPVPQGPADPSGGGPEGGRLDERGAPGPYGGQGHDARQAPPHYGHPEPGYAGGPAGHQSPPDGYGQPRDDYGRAPQPPVSYGGAASPGPESHGDGYYRSTRR